MKIPLERLASQLQKNLAPLYLISGDEPLLVQEACDAIRAQALKEGYNDRQVFYFDTKANWDEFLATANNYSLFSQRQLLEIHFKQAKLGTAGSKILQTYIANLPIDITLLLTMDKLDAANQKSAWMQAIDKVGVVVQVWSLDGAQLSRWIKQRLLQLGLEADDLAISLLAGNAEGNLLALKQELEKLSLLYNKGKLTVEMVLTAITDSARFDLFQLVDAALQGDSKKTLRIVSALEAERQEPTLVLWALSRELRSLAIISYKLAQGVEWVQVAREQGIWEKRKGLVKMALSRHSTQEWQQMLQQASAIDRMIKGAEPGKVWENLAQVCINIALKSSQ
ncbi:DNA polymerase III subunit delta [soil metagenome]